MAATLKRGATLCYLHERRGGGAVPLAAAALRELGLAAVVLDLSRPGLPDAVPLAAAARREARLLDAGLVAGPVDALPDAGAVAAFCDRFE